VVIDLTGVDGTEPRAPVIIRVDLDREVEAVEETLAEAPQEPWIECEIQEPDVELAIEEDEFPEPFQPEESSHQEPAIAPAAAAPRERLAPKNYIPTMKGNSCSHTFTQWQDGVMHPETHMLVMKCRCKDTSNVVAVILTSC
jgi:hypothetical protein